MEDIEARQDTGVRIPDGTEVEEYTMAGITEDTAAGEDTMVAITGGTEAGVIITATTPTGDSDSIGGSRTGGGPTRSMGAGPMSDGHTIRIQPR